MDALDRIAALQDGGKSILSESNSNISLPISPLKLDFNDDSVIEQYNDKENIKHDTLVPENDDDKWIEDKVMIDVEEEQTVVVQNTILADDLDKLFGIPSINVNVKDSWPGLLSDESLNEAEVEEEQNEDKNKKLKMKFKPNLRSADLIQFMSPKVKKQLEKKVTPKSRFQPKRKSSR